MHCSHPCRVLSETIRSRVTSASFLTPLSRRLSSTVLPAQMVFQRKWPWKQESTFNSILLLFASHLFKCLARRYRIASWCCTVTIRSHNQSQPLWLLHILIIPPSLSLPLSVSICSFSLFSLQVFHQQQVHKNNGGVGPCYRGNHDDHRRDYVNLPRWTQSASEPAFVHELSRRLYL